MTRLVLALRADAAVPGGASVLQVFGRGLWFDIAAASFAATPLVLWLALAPNRLARTWFYRSVTLFAFGAACFGLLLLAVSEWLFWDEFGARFNFIAVDYLLYTQEVIGNIWESYPVGRILVMLALAAAVATTLLARCLWQASGAPISWRTMFASVVVQAMLLAGVVQFADSDQKNFSSQDSANELAGNDLLHTLPSADRAFVANYQTLGYLKGDRLLVLQPKRKVEEFRIDADRLTAVPGVAPALAREGIAFYQLASHLFRSGLYADEEQVPPQARNASNAARQVATHGRR